jgi:hypothetical protein
MPTDHRIEQLSTTDITGSDAYATVTLHPRRSIQTAAIDGDEPRGVVIRVRLLPAERQRLQDVVARAVAKIDARRSAKANDPSISLDSPLPNEIP